MSRYLQGDYRQPPKPVGKTPAPRVLPKPGTYNAENMASIKTITTPNSGKI